MKDSTFHFFPHGRQTERERTFAVNTPFSTCISNLKHYVLSSGTPRRVLSTLRQVPRYIVEHQGDLHCPRRGICCLTLTRVHTPHLLAWNSLKHYVTLLELCTVWRSWTACDYQRDGCGFDSHSDTSFPLLILYAGYRVKLKKVKKKTCAVWRRRSHFTRRVRWTIF